MKLLVQVKGIFALDKPRLQCRLAGLAIPFVFAAMLAVVATSIVFCQVKLDYAWRPLAMCRWTVA